MALLPFYTRAPKTASPLVAKRSALGAPCTGRRHTPLLHRLAERPRGAHPRLPPLTRRRTARPFLLRRVLRSPPPHSTLHPALCAQRRSLARLLPHALQEREARTLPAARLSAAPRPPPRYTNRRAHRPARPACCPDDQPRLSRVERRERAAVVVHRVSLRGADAFEDHRGGLARRRGGLPRDGVARRGRRHEHQHLHEAAAAVLPSRTGRHPREDAAREHRPERLKDRLLALAPCRRPCGVLQRTRRGAPCLASQAAPPALLGVRGAPCLASQAPPALLGVGGGAGGGQAQPAPSPFPPHARCWGDQPFPPVPRGEPHRILRVPLGEVPPQASGPASPGVEVRRRRGPHARPCTHSKGTLHPHHHPPLPTSQVVKDTRDALDLYIPDKRCFLPAVGPNWMAKIECDKAPAWMCMRDGKVELASSPEDTARRDRKKAPRSSDKRTRRGNGDASALDLFSLPSLSEERMLKRRSSQDSFE